MNGTEPNIEIFKPFEDAFELMKKILFQPFDIRKWFVIGFAAFLASFSGGFQFHGNPFSAWSSRNDRQEIASSLHDIGPINQMDWWVIGLIVLCAVIVVALVIVLMWLGARGRFIFTDCIVHNRGAIVAPWKEFRGEGNSFFLFTLLVALCLTALVVGLALGILLPPILRGDHSRPGIGFWIALGVFLFLVVGMVFAWALISHLMVPIMYRQRCRAGRAFSQSIGLVSNYPGPILLYVLFMIVIIIAATIVGCSAICLTCCIAAIPYIGTVILLPIPVTLYGFTLMFLRQFGSDYDVWQGIPPLPDAIFSPPGSIPPVPPPLQT